MGRADRPLLVRASPHIPISVYRSQPHGERVWAKALVRARLAPSYARTLYPYLFTQATNVRYIVETAIKHLNTHMLCYMVEHYRYSPEKKTIIWNELRRSHLTTGPTSIFADVWKKFGTWSPGTDSRDRKDVCSSEDSSSV